MTGFESRFSAMVEMTRRSKSKEEFEYFGRKVRIETIVINKSTEFDYTEFAFILSDRSKVSITVDDEDLK